MPWYDILPDWMVPSSWHQPSAPSDTGHAEPAPAPPATATADPHGGLAPDEPKHKKSDLVYLGINDPSRAAEIAALPEGATVVDGSAKQHTIKSADGEKDLDLTKEADVQQFLAEAGVGKHRKGADGALETDEQVKARMEALEAVFLGKKGKDGKRVGTGMSVDSRDEMAELVQTMQKVEDGDIDMKRLIISGHHYEGEMGIHGPNGGITFADLGTVMNQFEHARDGVEDLMFSACNTVNGPKAQADVYKKIFPHLQTTWGYSGIAPAPGEDKMNSSPAHVGAWSNVSAGDDPALIEEEAKRRFRAKVYRY